MGIVVSLGAPDLTVSTRAQSRRAGFPSRSRGNTTMVLYSDAFPRTRIGTDTTGFAQSCAFADPDGMIGAGGDPKVVWAAIQNPLGQPHGSSGASGIVQFPASTDSSLTQSPYWHWGIWLPPGRFTSGAKLRSEYVLRITASNLDDRPQRDTTVPADGIPETADYAEFEVVLDPFGNPTVLYGKSNETDFEIPRPARIGWLPQGPKFASLTFDANASGDLRVDLTGYALPSGTYLFHTFSATATELIPTLTEGQGYVCTTGGGTNLLVFYRKRAEAVAADDTGSTLTHETFATMPVGSRIKVIDAGTGPGTDLTVNGIYYIESIVDDVTGEVTITDEVGGAAITFVGDAANVVIDFPVLYLGPDGTDLTGVDGDGTANTLSHDTFAQYGVDDEVEITDAGTTGLSLTTYFIESKVSDREVTIAATAGGAAVNFNNGTVECTVGAAGSYSSTLFLSRFSTGSRHQCRFPFRLALGDVTHFEDPAYCRLVIEGWAEGDGSNDTEDGVVWFWELDVPKNVSLVGPISSQAMLVGERKVYTGCKPMTGPGRTMNQLGTAQVPALLTGTAGALVVAKKDAYTDASTWVASGIAATTDGLVGTLEHDTFLALAVDAVVNVTNAGGSTIGTGIKYVHGRQDNRITVKNAPGAGAAINFTAGTPTATVGPASFDFFYPTRWNYGGNWCVVHYEGKLFQNPTGAGEVQYPLFSVQGSEVTGYSAAAQNSQAGRTATRTLVYRNAEADPVGEVIKHDDVGQMIFVRPLVDGEYVRFGDTLTLKTYRNIKASGGTGSFATNASELVQTLTNFQGAGAITAATVQMIPQPTMLGVRCSLIGPPNGDCEMDFRARLVELTYHGSR